jgi:hypothetical protein
MPRTQEIKSLQITRRIFRTTKRTGESMTLSIEFDELGKVKRIVGVCKANEMQSQIRALQEMMHDA